MAFLGNKGIVHRDLAARNVLVGETHDIIKVTYSIKISGIGLTDGKQYK